MCLNVLPFAGTIPQEHDGGSRVLIEQKGDPCSDEAPVDYIDKNNRKYFADTPYSKSRRIKREFCITGSSKRTRKRKLR